MPGEPPIEIVIKRCERRTRVRWLVVVLGALWILLLNFAEYFKLEGIWARLDPYGITEGKFNLTMVIMFFSFLLMLLYSMTCPMCVTSLLGGSKYSSGPFGEIRGDCSSCRKHFDLDTYVRKKGSL
jgi:hypothetical protein